MCATTNLLTCRRSMLGSLQIEWQHLSRHGVAGVGDIGQHTLIAFIEPQPACDISEVPRPP